MERIKLHRLHDIIIIAMCGVICGADGWVAIEAFGKAKEAFLRNCLICQTGYPLMTPMAQVFALLEPKQFEASFIQWKQGISSTIKGVIAIGGKTSRRTHDQQAARKPFMW